MFNTKSLRRKKQRAAKTFDGSSVLFLEVANRLMEKFSVINPLPPDNILDLGARTGYLSKKLSNYYSKASIVSLDLSENMLQCSSFPGVAAHLEALPFLRQAFDIIVSSLVLHELNDFAACFRELYHVLKPNGLLVFTLFGVDTLKELRASFSDQRSTHHLFPDMHNIGDCLIQSGLEQPVMEREIIIMEYKELKDLFSDLKLTGCSNVHPNKSLGLLGKTAWMKATKHYEKLKVDGCYPASFEIIYGHAWSPIEAKDQKTSDSKVSFESIL